MGVVIGAEGQTRARARNGGIPRLRWRMSAALPEETPASGGRLASFSALGVLGAATLTAIGIAAAMQTAPIAGFVTGETTPATVTPPAPVRAGLDFALYHVPGQDGPRTAALNWTLVPAPAPAPQVDPWAAAWREAALVTDRPVTVVSRPAPTAVRPAMPPTRLAEPVKPVLKPVVLASAGSADMPLPASQPHVAAHADPPDVPPPAVEKPRVSGSLVASLGTGDPSRWRAAPTTAAMIARFESIGYDLAAVRAAAAPVPRLYLDMLPRDLAGVSPSATKKRLFVQAVLPVILRVNEELVAARWRAKRLGDQLMRPGTLAPADREWLIGVAERYGTVPFDVPGLLSRMDIVPPSMALAQAAEETGWGSSRFVREGNALFGQYTYDSSAGMVPAQRGADQQHRVRRYDTLFEAAWAYAHNLNSHPAYEEFRRLRVSLRSDGNPIGGYDVAGGLQRYSERGGAYVESIRRLIRQNLLDDFDRASLDNRQWTAVLGLSSEWPI